MESELRVAQGPPFHVCKGKELFKYNFWMKLPDGLYICNLSLELF